MDELSEPAVARPSAWLFAVAYALHLLDEGLVAGGLPHWSTQHGFHLTSLNWLSVNAVSICVFGAAVGLVDRRTWPSWVLVSLAVHIALHAAIHLGASAWWLALSPGTITGVLLALPLAAWTLWWARHSLDRRIAVRAAVLGMLTFQAPWDLLVRLLFGLQFWSA